MTYQIPMIECRIITTIESADNLGDQLTLLGADAVTMQTAEATHEMTVIAYFENDSTAVDITTFLRQQSTVIKSFSMDSIEQQDWVRACLDQFVPQQMGTRLWICPSWHEPPVPEAVNVMLDPGLAFGTGTHPTTRLCLSWLDQHIQGGETIIDFGCGSGILAISALKLGAQHALAIDNEQQALDACWMNAALNHISADQLTVSPPDHLQAQPADILIANILAHPLIQLAPLFSTLVKPGGNIVLSGILVEQVDTLLEQYAQHFIMSKPVIQDEWVRLEGVKPA